jgi:hypothetical protein
MDGLGNGPSILSKLNKVQITHRALFVGNRLGAATSH